MRVAHRPIFAIHRLALVSMLVAAVAATDVTPAGARESRTAAIERRIDSEIQEALELNPGSRQIDAHTIELEKGVRMRIFAVDPDAEPAVQAQYYLCDYKWLCLFQHRDLLGYGIDFYNCGNKYLSSYFMPGGVPWNDQVSSIINNQTKGTWSSFFDWDGSSQWIWMKSLIAPGHLYNLAWDEAAYGGTMNDRIDMVTVC
jgi:hypothetical protein